MTKRALIVEDDADIARLVQLNLLDINCQATIVADGLAGLRAAVENPFDVILLDLTLPGLHGLEVCRLHHQALRHARAAGAHQSPPASLGPGKGARLCGRRGHDAPRPGRYGD